MPSTSSRSEFVALKRTATAFTRRATAAVVLCTLAVVSASAQPAQQPTAPDNPANPRRPIWHLFTDIGSDFAHLPSKDTVLWLSVGSGLALAAHAVDDDVNAHLVGANWVHETFEPGRVIGYAAVQFGGAALTYAYGRLDKRPKIVHIGVDLLRAQIVAQGLTLGLKYATQRERPDHSNNHSFPSGHASVTFASATVLQRHFGWRGAVAYTAASYVAASRLHENRHFLSDVVFGAAIGTVAGRTVTRHGRDSWGIDVAPVPGRGMMFSVSKIGDR